MTELGNKIINLQALDVQTLGHYWRLLIIKNYGVVDLINSQFQ
jgi:hypothetical protein